jgi:stress-induced morphogen|tara:strand:- start:252 stop:488 length:237 start_codon:yes stop_codon:yes gene_type:complete
MPLTKNQISTMILKAFPDATIELKDIAGDSNHYSAKIMSKIFNGKSKIEQHKMVYKALEGKMGNELHALALTTEEKNG